MSQSSLLNPLKILVDAASCMFTRSMQLNVITTVSILSAIHTRERARAQFQSCNITIIALQIAFKHTHSAGQHVAVDQSNPIKLHLCITCHDGRLMAVLNVVIIHDHACTCLETVGMIL